MLRRCLVAVAIVLHSAAVVPHAAEPAAKVRLLSLPKGSEAVAARTDAKGTIHIVYHSTAGPQYARSTDDGRTLGEPLAVVQNPPAHPGLVFTAWDVAVSPAGEVHVALGTNGWKLKRPKEEWAFHYARLESDAKTFTPIVNLNRQPSEGFSLAADGRGRVTACWLSGKLYAAVSHDHGKTFGPAAEIDRSFDPCDCCTSICAYDAAGRLAVLYREQTNNDRDMFLALWDQERQTVRRTRISTTLWKTDSCPMSYYALTPQGDGFLAAWPTKDEIYFARLDRDGALRDPGEVKTGGATSHRSGMSIVADAQGRTLVAWKRNGELSWQLFDAQARPQSAPETVKSPGKSAAAVLTRSGEFVLIR